MDELNKNDYYKDHAVDFFTVKTVDQCQQLSSGDSLTSSIGDPWKIKMVNSMYEFTKNLKERFHYDYYNLQNFQWCLEVDDVSNYVLAGGSVLNALRKDAEDHKYAGADLDIFVLGSNDDIQMCAAIYLLHHLYRSFPEGYVDFVCNRSVVTVRIRDKHPLQIILLPDARNYNDVLFEFDQSCCSVGFDGDRVFATRDAIQAFRTGINRVNVEKYYRLANYNADKSDLTFARRIRKMMRKGFEIEFDAEAFDAGAVPSLKLQPKFWLDVTKYPDIPREEQISNQPSHDIPLHQDRVRKSFSSELLRTNIRLLPQCVSFSVFKKNVSRGVKRKLEAKTTTPVILNGIKKSDGFTFDRICLYGFLCKQGISGNLGIYQSLKSKACKQCTACECFVNHKPIREPTSILF